MWPELRGALRGALGEVLGGAPRGLPRTWAPAGRRAGVWGPQDLVPRERGGTWGPNGAPQQPPGVSLLARPPTAPRASPPPAHGTCRHQGLRVPRSWPRPALPPRCGPGSPGGR
ncbi:unnamed protein product [Eretmochelys imbricata]